MNVVIWSLVALLGLFQGATGVETELEPLLNDKMGAEYLLLENSIIIHKLYQYVDRLKERLKTKPVDVAAIYRKAEHAVNRLEGTGCEDNEVQCGSIERQCVSKLLICDGVKDCVNGHDEDPSYCDVSQIRAGLSFSGWFTEGSCLEGSHRTLYFCRMRVSSVTRSSIFGSVMPMKTRWSCTKTVLGVGNSTDFPMIYTGTGTYEIANRRWYSEAAGYTDYCQFPDDSFDLLRCETYVGQTQRCNTGTVMYRDN